MPSFIFPTLRLCRLLLIEQLREPVGIFWSVIAPPILFTFLNMRQAEAHSLEGYLISASWYLGYIAITVSMFSFALYFVGRRESGFVRSFIVGTPAKLMFVIAQALASFGLACLSFAVFVLVTAFVANVSIFGVMVNLFPSFVIALLFSMSACLAIAALPVTFQNASSGISILSALLLILSLSGNYADPNPLIEWINFSNPLLLWASFIASGGEVAFHHVVLMVISFGLGLAGFRYFRFSPVWNRQ